MAITYNLTTNFLDKDSLPENDPAKVIRGSEFQTEFLSIQSAFSSAAPTASPSFTGTAVFNAATMTDLAVTNPIVGSITGNVTGDITGDVTGNLTGNVTGNLTGNVTGNLTGTVLTAAQTNITSVGTLSSLNVSGNLAVNTDTLFVNSSSGNVGIGTSSPQEGLHLAGSFNTLRLDDNTNHWNIQGGNNLAINRNGTEYMRIFSGGNVGIGTTTVNDNYKAIIQGNDQETANLADSGEHGATLFLRAAAGAPGSGGAVAFGTTFGNQRPFAAIKGFVTDGANNTTGALCFSTRGAVSNTSLTERMRIDASGNLLVGTTSTGISAEGFKYLTSTGITRLVNSGVQTLEVARTEVGGGTQVIFYANGSSVGTISSTGAATSYNTSSDVRLKENIVDAPSASADIDAIQIRSFDWKADGTHQKYGVIAQELVAVAPDAVTQGETEGDTWGMDYSKLVPMLVKEIQDLRARVAQLESGV